jgi:hypothetical protein
MVVEKIHTKSSSGNLKTGEVNKGMNSKRIG